MSLEELRALFRKDVFATELCGIVIDGLTPNGARLSMPVTGKHMNSNGVVQGGAIYTLCDTAFAVAANQGDRLTVSRSADITYVKPGKGPRLYAEAELLSSGKSTCLCRVSVYDEERALVAYMTGNGFVVAR
jgi:acyl-CoA thioesterase